MLDLFILSLLDRGLETPYDLQRQGGLSLGSTVPALRRLETAGLVRKREALEPVSGPATAISFPPQAEPSHKTVGRRYLKAPNQMDVDAVLRVADMAQHYNARRADMVEFFEAVVSERRVPGRSRISDPDGMSGSLGHMPTFKGPGMLLD